MKTKFTLLLFTALSCFQLSAQKDITNELIWYSRTFIPDDVEAVRSMNDGEHFTTLEADGKNVTEVNKYAYKDYAKKGTIVNSADVKRDGEPVMIEDYEFN